MSWSQSSRFLREFKTLTLMTRAYCKAHHEVGCEACARFLAYARSRLEKCPYQELKPACAKCPIHCYQAEAREEAKMIMRYAGPRMLKDHPWLALAHLWDDWRSLARLQVFKRRKKGTKK